MKTSSVNALYVKSPVKLSNKEAEKVFAEYGKVKNARMKVSANGVCIGLIVFKKAQSARNCLNNCTRIEIKNTWISVEVSLAHKKY